VSAGDPTARDTILVADDNAVATRVLSNLFAPEGFAVRTASGGAEALALLRRETPDLVILDVQMPGMDGFELCRRIRAQPALRGIPVLAFTLASELEAKLRGFEAGVDDFITKDTSSQELLARVRALLARRAAWASSRDDAAREPAPGRAVAFFSLKGGSGTSTLATNAVVPYDAEFVQALNEGKPRALREERRPTRALLALIDLAERIDTQLARMGVRAEAPDTRPAP
jgi:DNA-binding response OmpR family regulator